MWFGTDEGLACYDGRQVRLFKSVGQDAGIDGPVGNQTRFIVADSTGNLFFTSDNALMTYDLRSERFSCLRETGISCVASVSGQIYVGVRDSVCRFDRTTGRLIPFLHFNESGQHLNSFVRDSRGTYWLGTNRGLYRRTPSEGLTCVIPDADVYAVFEDSRRGLWVSTRMRGLFRLRGDSITRYTDAIGAPLRVCRRRLRQYLDRHLSRSPQIQSRYRPF
jgi:ligand-binding sensor domain-containing protein